jgi:hypothetical protein
MQKMAAKNRFFAFNSKPKPGLGYETKIFVIYALKYPCAQNCIQIHRKNFEQDELIEL